MSEKRLIVDGLQINYKGLFDIDEFLKKIDSITGSRGYIKQEKERQELVKPGGKEFFLELRPTKRKTDYYILMIKLRITITNLKDVDVTIDNIKTKLNDGNINIIFDAWTTTDYEYRWEQKPLFFFLRNMIERVTWKFHTDVFTDELDDDCHYIFNELKSYLEMHKFRTFTPEP